MNRSKAIIKDAAKFTIGGYISSVCNFISATVVRRILDPFFMGVYSELLLVFDYAKYNHLGIIDSLDRQIPYYNGAKEFGKAEEAKNVGASFALYASFILALSIIAFSYIMKNNLSPLLAGGLKVVAVMVVIQSLGTFYVTLMRTHHLFGPLSKYIIIIAIFDIIFKVVLGLKFGVIGILWGTAIPLSIGIFYLYRKTGMGFKLLFRIPAKTVSNLLTIGFPLLLAGFAMTLLRSIDRLMIIAFLTKEDLGFYSIAIMVHSFIFQLPNLIYTVLFPRFYEAFGESSGRLDGLEGFLKKPTLVFAYLFPVLIGMAVITFPVFINYILPKYTQGVIPTYILLFGTFFLSITYMSGYLLIALKKQYMLVLISVVSIAVCVLANLLFLNIFGLGIKGVALGTSFAYFVYSLLLIGYAMRRYLTGLYEKLKFLIQVYTPILWVMAIFYFFRFFLVYKYESIYGDVKDVLLRLMLFLALTFPLLFYANRKAALLGMLKMVNR